MVKTQGYDITILLFDLYVWLKFVVLLLPAFAEDMKQQKQSKGQSFGATPFHGFGLLKTPSFVKVNEKTL